MKQLDAPLFEVNPLPQLVHCVTEVAPELARYLPVGHDEQAVFAAAAAYWPALQLEQLVAPALLAYFPVGHAEHE